MCQSGKKKHSNTNAKAQAQTHVHVIFHLGSGFPPYQAEKTVLGRGELNLSGPEFPLKELNHVRVEGYSQVKPRAGQSTFAIRAWKCVSVCVCALYQSVCFNS